jgi:glutaryl-CoA dehydrogenase
MAKPSFTWEDPLLLDSQLAADERQVRNAARDFAQKALQPRIRDAFRHETTDPAIFREMGEAPARRDAAAAIWRRRPQLCPTA